MTSISDAIFQVCYKGPNIFQGYLYDEEKTNEAFDEDGWLHSGDIGKWLPSGTLKIVDRKKNIFKLAQVLISFFVVAVIVLIAEAFHVKLSFAYVQGEYIAPEKVEEIYHACPIVHQVFVTGIGTEVH